MNSSSICELRQLACDWEKLRPSAVLDTAPHLFQDLGKVNTVDLNFNTCIVLKK